MESLDLTHSQISRIAPGAFGNRSNLRSLGLNFNQLSTISQLDFSSLVLLNNLSLKSFTIEKPTRQSITELYEFFKRSPFRNLRYLNLESNDIVWMPLRFLCPMESLQSVHLSYNKIRFLHLNLTCLPSLEKFYIKKNNLIAFKDNFFRQIQFDFRYDVFFYMAENRPLCNCGIVPFLKAYNRSKMFHFADLEDVKCSRTSGQFKEYSLQQLRVSEFDFCTGNETKESTTILPEVDPEIVDIPNVSEYSYLKQDSALKLTVIQLLALILISTMILNAILVSLYVVCQRYAPERCKNRAKMQYNIVPRGVPKGVPRGKRQVIGSDAHLADFMRPSILNILQGINESTV